MTNSDHLFTACQTCKYKYKLINAHWQRHDKKTLIVYGEIVLPT